MSDLILFDPRGVFSTLDHDLIKRHQEYIAAAKKQSNGQLDRLVIFTIAPKTCFRIYSQGLIEIHGLSSISFFSAMLKKNTAKEFTVGDLNPGVITCSDPWTSFLCGWNYKKYLFTIGKKVNIQLQIHGDFFSKKWKNQGILSLIKSMLAKHSIKKADQVRFVSISMAQEAIQKRLVDGEKVVIAPVPISLAETSSTPPQKHPRSIGFVGRIQKERGLVEFSNLAKRLFSSDPEVSLIIVGDGEERRNFEDLIKKSIPEGRFEFTGHLESEDLELVWNKIGILVSTAPSESYGRALREALIHGVAVWSTRTRGLDDLISENPWANIRVIDFNRSDSELMEDLEHLLSQERDTSYRRQYETARAAMITEIGDFWARLL
jgi:glycosyltransferase involved in cell wall biosynthesis